MDGAVNDDGARDLLARASALAPGSTVGLHEASIFEGEGMRLALVEIDGRQWLLVEGREGADRRFEKERQVAGDGTPLSLCPLSPANAEALRSAAPFTTPSVLGGSAVTIGLGDRLGCAGTGHLRAVCRFQAAPVLAQQSPRELTLTSRSFQDVLDAATWAVFREGFRGPWGADGDHVKTESQVESALASGFTMITADVSDSLHAEWARKSDAEVSAAYQGIDPAYRREIEGRYEGKAFPLLSGDAVKFTRLELERTVLVYREGLDHAERLFRAAASHARSSGFDFELSVDETASPTTPQAHLFIASEAKRRGVRLTSLAPRFVGEFEKSIDYIGSVAGFERDFAAHAALAETQGYRLSVHSGSDKFSLYSSIGRLSGDGFTSRPPARAGWKRCASSQPSIRISSERCTAADAPVTTRPRGSTMLRPTCQGCPGPRTFLRTGCPSSSMTETPGGCSISPMERSSGTSCFAGESSMSWTGTLPRIMRHSPGISPGTWKLSGCRGFLSSRPGRCSPRRTALNPRGISPRPAAAGNRAPWQPPLCPRLRGS